MTAEELVKLLTDAAETGIATKPRVSVRVEMGRLALVGWQDGAGCQQLIDFKELLQSNEPRAWIENTIEHIRNSITAALAV